MSDSPTDVSFLDWDPSHLGDDFEDATLVKFEGWETTRWLPRSSLVRIPTHVYFEANFRTLQKIDYPINEVSWPIVSRRMLDVLRSIEPGFDVPVVPVTMLDDTVGSHRRRDASGAYRDDVQNHDFVALSLDTLSLDALDGGRAVDARLIVRIEDTAGSKVALASRARRALVDAGCAGLVFAEAPREESTFEP